MLQRRPMHQKARPERKPMAWPGLQSFKPVTRCDGAGTAHPKKPRAQNRALLDLAAGKPCLLQSPLCVGGTETTVACHGAGVANGKGLGYKVSDALTCWGCYACNHYTDAFSLATKAQKEAVFMLGHLRQVNEWRRIASGPASKEQRAALWALEQLNATPIGETP